jgi:hypothetical protein
MDGQQSSLYFLSKDPSIPFSIAQQDLVNPGFT